MRTKGLLLISTLLLAGCGQQGGGGGEQPARVSQPGAGILGSLRPKTDPAVVERMRIEQQARVEKEKALEAAAKAAENQANADGSGRILPRVSMDPIAPPAEEVANSSGPMFTPANSNAATIGATPIPVPSGGGGQQIAMTYGAVPPPPMAGYGGGGGGVPTGGLVPPPPAVTLSTQANIGMPAGIPMDPSAMYANPYMNPYGINYPQMQNMANLVPPVPSVPMGRPSGSLFGSGGGGGHSGGGDDDESASERKPRANFVPITPTGMQPRSAYGQRDDLKALWNGVLKTNVMSALMKDSKFSGQLSGVEIALPGEATRGNLGVSQRQVDNIFKNSSLDKRILAPVHKVQTDLAQAYYRYVYSYNKYALATQTLAARKQEAEVASSDSERQRAAADQAQAQNEAESAKDDMKSAQQELAMVAGPAASKFVITKVSGAAPSIDIASAESAPASKSAKNSGGGGGGMFSMFHWGGGDEKKPAPAAEEPKVASVAADKKKEKEKEPKKGKGKKDSGASKEQDLAPAPTASSDGGGASETAAAPAANPAGISFELKNVSTTARKSILTVSIKNGGANNFSFSPDVISISEGSHKLAEAAVRADFDQTMVQPNQEIKGTITIFGRPWNERLAVSLSEGGKIIQMSRR